MQPDDLHLQDALSQLYELSQQFQQLDVPREEIPTLFLRTIGSESKPQLTVEKRGFFQWIVRTIWSKEYELTEGSRTTLFLTNLNQVLANKTDAQIDEAIEKLREKHPDINVRDIAVCQKKLETILKHVQEKKLIKARQQGGIVPTILLFQKLGVPNSALSGIEKIKVRIDTQLDTLKKRLQAPVDKGEASVQKLREQLANGKMALASNTLQTIVEEIQKQKERFQLVHSLDQGIQELQAFHKTVENGQYKKQIEEIIQSAVKEKESLEPEVAKVLHEQDRRLLALFSLFDIEGMQKKQQVLLQELAQLNEAAKHKVADINQFLSQANTHFQFTERFGTDPFVLFLQELGSCVELLQSADNKQEALEKLGTLTRLYQGISTLHGATSETLDAYKAVWRDNQRLTLIHTLVEWYASNRERADEILAGAKAAAKKAEEGAKSKEELLALKNEVQEAIRTLETLLPIAKMSSIHERKFRKMLPLMRDVTRKEALMLIEEERKVENSHLKEAYLARDRITILLKI